MGGDQARFNAPHRYQLAWLNPASAQLAPARGATLALTSNSVLDASNPALGIVRVVRGGVAFWLSLRTSAASTAARCVCVGLALGVWMAVGVGTGRPSGRLRARRAHAGARARAATVHVCERMCVCMCGCVCCCASFDRLLSSPYQNSVSLHRWNPSNGNTLLVATLKVRGCGSCSTHGTVAFPLRGGFVSLFFLCEEAVELGVWLCPRIALTCLAPACVVHRLPPPPPVAAQRRVR
jgi:hypothetical protein